MPRTIQHGGECNINSGSHGYLSLIHILIDSEGRHEIAAVAYPQVGKAVERYNEGKVSVVEVIDAQTYRQTSQVNW